jgi:hypothetical protein
MTGMRMRTIARMLILAGVAVMSTGSAALAAESIPIESFTASAGGYTQAGGHPYAFTTTLAFETEPNSHFPLVQVAKQDARNVRVDLPPGLIGNPEATRRCSIQVFTGTGGTGCAASTQVGVSRVTLATASATEYTTGVYNLVPEGASPAELGLATNNGVVFVLETNVLTGEGYGVTVLDSGVPVAGLVSVEITLWGTPADPSHNAERGRACSKVGVTETCEFNSEARGEKGAGTVTEESSGEPLVPFLTMPTDCAGGELETTVFASSWESAGETEKRAKLPAVTGCNLLTLNPTIKLAPDTSHVDSPAGLTFALDVPQTNSPNTPATPELRDVTVTLPAGMSVSPSAGDGLEACSDAQFAERSRAAAQCPEGSKIGSVQVTTPLLSSQLEGELFVGEPLCGNAAHPAPCEAKDAEDGNMFRLFMQARGSGVTLKLPGTMSVNQATGQVTTSFRETPQLPFSELKLNLDGGPRAPLATPQTCGSPAASAYLVPWSAPGTPPVNVLSPPFEVTGCSSPMGFAPSFTAGTLKSTADGFSPFTMTLSRKDGEQDLGGLSMTMPPGVEGMLAKVPLCGEPQAQLGQCSEASRIGTANAAAGAGSHPLWLAGPVYLTGPYKGAPFGLSIVVPAKAGPFNLGNVVVRSAINVDPKTAQITVTSDPLPQSRDGVPFRLKTLNVTIDREGFMFNPTNCSQLHVSGTVSGDMPDGSPGATVPVSTPFAVAGCKNLPFKPSFTALAQAKHSKKNGASLHVVVKSGAGQANIGSVKVNLPKQLPSRLSTLKLACLEKVFNANPAGCPAGSKVGSATAYTPVLPVALKGPAYFVSHGGAKFPELVVVLQGDGVTVDLAGETFISKAGITSSTFRSVPDVPITRFDLVLPTGAHSALAGNGSFCKGAMYMPTQIKGQNGAVVKQKTKIAVTGCPKPKKKAKAKAKKKK